MKFQKIITGFAAVVISVSLMSSAWAKPGNNRHGDNHGSRVSRTARDKDDDNDYKNHGQKVSKVARKNAQRKRRYRTVRRYNQRTRRYENVRRWSYYDTNSRTWRRE